MYCDMSRLMLHVCRYTPIMVSGTVRLVISSLWHACVIHIRRSFSRAQLYYDLDAQESSVEQSSFENLCLTPIRSHKSGLTHSTPQHPLVSPHRTLITPHNDLPEPQAAVSNNNDASSEKRILELEAELQRLRSQLANIVFQQDTFNRTEGRYM